MKRTMTFCLAATVASLAIVPILHGEENLPPRGYRYFTPANGSRTTYRYQPVSGTQPVVRPTAATVQAPTLPPVGQQVVLRPVSWGSRLAVAFVYPTAVYGQYVQAPGQPATPSYDGPYSGSSGINPDKYSYAGRGPGNYYYASAYNSGFYTTGCYEANACCRCCRRRCTLFGGMAYGCGPGCYTSIPLPCSTACAYGVPYGSPAAPPANGTPTPAPSTAPPTPAPPTPAPGADDGAPPQPIEKKVTPAPQANLFPQIPGLPPDA
jgi:hypothetical protein